MQPDEADTLECGRCGRRHALTPDLAGKSIACPCGQLIAVPMGESYELTAAEEEDAAAQVQAPQGVEERNLPQGVCWLASGEGGVTAYLLTESELKVKQGITSSVKKFDKKLEEKGSIDELAKNKWSTTIPLDAITALERAELDNFVVVHYTEKGKARKLKVSQDGTNLHALVFEALRLILAPDRQPVATPMSAWEISGPPVGGLALTLFLGGILIAASFATKAPTSGKGKVIVWLATWLGTTGCVAITAAALAGIAIWMARRFRSRPMKEVLVIKG